RAKEESKDGRRLARWDFTMPREASKYTLTKEGRETIIGYSGSFWADTETADVVRLEWTPDNIPPETGIKTITQSVNYGRNAIAGVSVLLPTASELIVAETHFGLSGSAGGFVGFGPTWQVARQAPSPGGSSPLEVRIVFG